MKLQFFAFISTALVIFSGCGGSNAPLSSENNATTLTGPLNYEAVANRMQGHTALQSSGSDYETRSTLSNVSLAMGLAAAFCPELAPVLVPISKITSYLNGKNTADEISQIDDELATLQYDVNIMQQEIIGTAKATYDMYKLVTTDDLCEAFTYWEESIASINAGYYSSVGNLCGETISTAPADSLNERFSVQLVDGNLTQTAQNQNAMNSLNTLALTSSMQGYVEAITASMTASSMQNPSYATVSTALESVSTDCAPAEGNNISYQQFLQCQYNALLTLQLKPWGSAYGYNIVDLITQYNNMIMAMYQQNVIAMQYAYNIEAASNYLNYLNYQHVCENNVSGNLTQISAWESNLAGSITFKAESCNGLNVQQAQAAFENNQTSLAVLYAARGNALYTATIRYLVSDPMVSTQPITTAPDAELETFKTLYNPIVAATLSDPQIAMNNIPGGEIINSGNVFYQYGYINDIYSCIGSSLSASLDPSNTTVPTVDLNNCKSAFPDSNLSYYDGQEMRVYQATSDAAQGVILTNNVLDINQSCYFNSQPIIYAPGNNNFYLTCALFGGEDMTNSTVFPAADTVSYPPNISYMEGSGLTNLSVQTNKLGHQQIVYNAYYTIAQNSSSSTFYLLGSTYLPYDANDSAAPNYSSAVALSETINEIEAGTPTQNPNPYSGAYNLTTDYQADGDSGMVYTPVQSFDVMTLNGSNMLNNLVYAEEVENQYHSSTTTPHTVLLQVVLPNGYAFPFYMVNVFDVYVTVNAYIVCPNVMTGIGTVSLTPGVSLCTQQNNNTSIQVQTEDGNSYSITLTVGNNQGTPSAYLEVN